MDLTSTIALSLGAAWASGINLYAAVFMLGLLGSTGAIALPSTLVIVQNPVVMSAAGIMFFIEFFADKIPGVDSAWDAIHTFIRIPAGAVLAAAALGPVDPAWSTAAGLVGGTLAASTHATKAGTRVLLNTSPEPFSNWFASIGEDVAVILGIWTAVAHPYVFLVLLAISIVMMALLLPVLIRGVTSVFRWLSTPFRRTPPTSVAPPTPGAPSTNSVS